MPQIAINVNNASLFELKVISVSLKEDIPREGQTLYEVSSNYVLSDRMEAESLKKLRVPECLHLFEHSHTLTNWQTYYVLNNNFSPISAPGSTLEVYFRDQESSKPIPNFDLVQDNWLDVQVHMVIRKH